MKNISGGYSGNYSIEYVINRIIDLRDNSSYLEKDIDNLFSEEEQDLYLRDMDLTLEIEAYVYYDPGKYSLPEDSYPSEEDCEIISVIEKSTGNNWIDKLTKQEELFIIEKFHQEAYNGDY